VEEDQAEDGAAVAAQSASMESWGGIMKSKLTVGDLFCGAGGFSEGFRQAGFKVAWGVDSWGPAVSTFGHNFRGARAVKADLLEFDLETLEPVDVLVGGPPCTHFSLANKGGNGDLAAGLALVKRYLDAVRVLKPKHWVMENVPNLRAIIDRATQAPHPTITESDLERYLPIVRILNAAKFGTPQNRLRLFSGDFPPPEETTTYPIPMKKVVFGLPPPFGPKASRSRGTVSDPLYEGVTLARSDLTDHWTDTSLGRAQAEMAKQAKLSHPWYGKMKFPDALDVPSRTIAATASKSSRASIVIRDPRVGSMYRIPTPRECASLQGFPITFQFWGAGAADKQRLVGNAVPPPVARALATRILKEEGLHPQETPTFELGELPAPLPERKSRRPFRFQLDRPYRGFVPGTLPYLRVELDNKGERMPHPAGEDTHIVGWRAVIYIGYARDYASFVVGPGTAVEILKIASQTTLDGHFRQDFPDAVVRRCQRELPGNVPDASTLQAAWAGRAGPDLGPDKLLARIAELAQDIARRPSRDRAGVEAGQIAHLLRGRFESGGDDYRKRRWTHEVLDSYTVCSLVLAAMAAKLANEGTGWIKANWGKHFTEKTRPAELEVHRDRLGPTDAVLISPLTVSNP
jgi:site-specific DNA-cytosine methylase